MEVCEENGKVGNGKYKSDLITDREVRIVSSWTEETARGHLEEIKDNRTGVYLEGNSWHTTRKPEGGPVRHGEQIGLSERSIYKREGKRAWPVWGVGTRTGK